MTRKIDQLGVVSWNVNCAVDPQDQIDHILTMDKLMRKKGAKHVLFCLQEMTAPTSKKNLEITLEALLKQDGFTVKSRPTSVYRKKQVYEGIAFASKDRYLDSAIKRSRFHNTHTQIAHWFKIQNILHRYKLHERRVAQIQIDEITIFNTHASFHTPPKNEIYNILRTVGHAKEDQQKLLVGDLNAGTKRIIRRLRNRGWQRLKSNGLQRTWRWLTLDYAFCSPALKSKAKIQIYGRGPSDHKPLLVTIKK